MSVIRLQKNETQTISKKEIENKKTVKKTITTTTSTEKISNFGTTSTDQNIVAHNVSVKVMIFELVIMMKRTLIKKEETS